MNETRSKAHDTDWLQVELEFRAGIKVLRAIAGDYKITEGAIRARAKRHGWIRDLAPRIEARAEELLRRRVVRKSLRSVGNNGAEAQIVEANADMMAVATLRHRKDVARARELCQSLVEELTKVTGRPSEIQALIAAVSAASEDAQKIAKELGQALSLPSRIGSMDKLSAALDRLIKLERLVLGIDKDKAKGGAIEEMLVRLDFMAANG